MLFLNQGEMTILDRPTLVSTVLGSCAAITFFCRRLSVAAISHALLPHCRRRVHVDNIKDLLSQDCVHCPEAYKYVDCAICMMTEAFSRLGIAQAETEVRLYGGSKMIASLHQPGGMAPVGHQNTDTAKKIIADHGLKLHECNVGGTGGRKIIFNTQTGQVTLLKTGLPDPPVFPVHPQAQKGRSL